MTPRRPLPALLALALLALAGPAARASSLASGRVVDAETGAPVAGARVTAGGSQATTGADGAFALDLAPGAVTAEASAPGYDRARRELQVPDSGPLPGLVFALIRSGRFRDATEVVAPSRSAPADLPVRPLDVAATAGGGENIFRTLHTLPGVAATEEFGSRLSVRGGGPDQNLTVMDGVEIHNPYRLFGLTSAFNPEIVESFELQAGGFAARHGDRLSSLLVVENRAGTEAERLRGTAALSITDANVVLEGRLPGARPGSWLVTGRRTYYDLVANKIVDTDLPAFADLQAKLAWAPRPGQRLTLFALRSRESADAFVEGDPGEQGDFVSDVSNDVAALGHSAALGGWGALRSVAAWNDNAEGLDVVAHFRYDGRRSNAPTDAVGFVLAGVDFARSLAVRDLSLREELTARAGRHLLESGFELHRLQTHVRWDIVGERNPTAANGSSVQGGAGLPDRLDSSLPATRLGGWVQDRLQSGRLETELGLRLDHSTVNGQTALSPRASFTWTLGPRTRLRGGGGLYTQSPGYEKLIQSDYFVDLDQAGLVRNERSTDALLGLERDLGAGATLRLEGYWKEFDRLIVGRLETEEELQARLDTYAFPEELQGEIPTGPIITDQPTNDGRGTAYGFDLYLTRRSAADHRLGGWASYTYGMARRDAYGRTYPFSYDRRHALSVAATWHANRWLELSTTTRVASGFPRTPVLGLHVSAQEVKSGGPGGAEVLVPARDAAGRLVYEADYGGVENLNAARLPLFARVDLRATFRPHGPAGRWQLYLDVINVFGRQNAGQIDAILDYDPGSDRPALFERRVLAVPFLPSLGVRFRF